MPPILRGGGLEKWKGEHNGRGDGEKEKHWKWFGEKTNLRTTLVFLRNGLAETQMHEPL